MTDWPAELDREVERIAGPEDEPDERVNGDPDSTVGDDDVDESSDEDEDDDEE